MSMSKNNKKFYNQRLGKFLLRIDKKLTREEIEYIFNKFDEDGSNSIEFAEFSKWLEENDVFIAILP
jgi:calcium-dependent protein kinase